MWVARDKCGALWLFNEKPERVNDYYWDCCREDSSDCGMELSEDFFGSGFLKWESEPIEVGITGLKQLGDIKEFLKTLKRLNLLNPEMIKTEEDFNNLIKSICG